jgi:WASH complex subunit strumpellin
LQVRQFLEDTRKFLTQMLRAGNVREDWLVALQMIGDLSYAWNTIDSLTPLMQRGIKEDPSLVSKLRATFLKVSARDKNLYGTNSLKTYPHSYQSTH